MTMTIMTMMTTKTSSGRNTNNIRVTCVHEAE